MSKTDWNDLQQLAGRDEVRRQLLAALHESPDESPAPSDQKADAAGAGVAVPTVTQMLERFAWTVPDGKVWDAHDRKLIKPNQLKAWVGKDSFAEWMSHDERRTVAHADVARAAAAAEKAGSGEVAAALARFVLLYPSQDVWDRQRREIVSLNALKPLLHRWYQIWLEHPDRQVIDREKLVFDPPQQYSPDEGYINMFRGLPLSPVVNPDGCLAIRRLVNHLCNGEPAVFDWVMNWLALPVQRVGSKMLTAIMMHSETQGTGKSLLFEEVVKPIYGEYAATLGQHQLESQYTGWRSKKLFGVFEEILSRDQKYSHTGTIKHMITGKTQRIEEKFISGWEESNYLNAVFLSNEIQPFPCEPSDRRMCVIWPEKKLPAELRDAVMVELANGGVEAFYGWLLRRRLAWVNPVTGQEEEFTRRTEPPMTSAKERLIEFGRPSWDVFHRDWRQGEFAPEFPYGTCKTDHLWQLYKRWCSRLGLRAMSCTQFVVAIAARERKRQHMEYRSGGRDRKGAFFLVGDAPSGKAQKEWLTDLVSHWEQEFHRQEQPDKAADP